LGIKGSLKLRELAVSRKRKLGHRHMHNSLKKLSWWSALLGLVLATTALATRASAQDDSPQQDDPPSRVARLGYMEGSVSFDPAGEQDWVGATDNRPLTTGDKLWADKGSRAELQLGSAVIRLSENTGISFLNLDDHSVQVQLSSGAINIRVRSLDQDDSFEIDTPNLAFSLYRPGSYRVEASEDGSNTVVTVREGDGEATGNGQSYKIHAGQTTTFSGTDSLEADMEQIGDPDQFDNWAYNRDHRWENSRSARYVSPDVVGYDDLDDNGDWRDEGDYGHVWYPHVAVGWAPYRDGHWAWIDPWGYTWVDDAPWGYAPFHYGRWVSVSGRWGWVAGPVAVRAVYAPALVVFVGGGGGWGGNIGWFPLGPREVYVPSYQVSRAYVQRVNISNTTVNNTTITNVYNTTIVNKTTNITNVTYVNRNVQGGMTAVPQRAFASAQPVARTAVSVNAEQMRAAPVSARVAVNPTREAVLGSKAATANRVTAPPAAVMNRQVIAKQAPPPPPPTFAARQQAMQAHPGQPLPRQELARMAPAASAAVSRPVVKVAPPAKPATPTTGHPPNNQPANNQPANNSARPGQPAPGNPPANRPGNQPAANERPGAAMQPNNRPQPNQPENRPPAAQPNNRPGQPENRPPAAQPNNRPNQPENPSPASQPNNRPGQPENRPPAAQPNTRPNQPENRPPAAEPNNRQPENRPPAAQPNNRPNQPENRPPAAQPNNRPPQQENRPQAERPPQRTPPPAEGRQAAPPQKQQQKQPPPEEKKKKDENKPPGA
jgi:hypothetical protein